METYLYVIAESYEGPVKIGYSAQPEKRLKQLQTGASTKLNLCYQQSVKNNEAKRIERMIHKTLGYKRSHGEWFNLSVEEAIIEVQFGLMSEA